MFDDPAKQQYLKFSAVIAFLISFVLNFPLNAFVQTTTSFGFPFSTKDAGGFASLGIQSINMVIMGFFLIVPIYMFLDYLNKRR